MRAVHVIALAVAAAIAIAPFGIAKAADAPAASASPAAVATPAWCPLSTHVQELDDTHTRYAVSFSSFEAGLASGIVALWAGNRRYDVPFHDAVAIDSRDRTASPSPVVVRFAAPTLLDGAVVTSIDEGGELRPCEPWFSPWAGRAPPGPDRRTPDERRLDERFLGRARAAAAIDAPAAINDPRPCTTPDRPARTVYAVEPNTPGPGLSGLSEILVLLDPSNKVVNVRVERSSGNRSLDYVALAAARRSEFQGQTFRCRPIMGSYIFSVQFNP